MRAYHFVGRTLRDGNPVPPDGEWLIHDDGHPIVMCSSGLHASRHPFDAVRYASGPILCLVECESIVKEEEDELVCARRKILRRFDATEILSQMVRWSALQVAGLWGAPPILLDYLRSGDEDKRAEALLATNRKRQEDILAIGIHKKPGHHAALAATMACQETTRPWFQAADVSHYAALASIASFKQQRDYFAKLVDDKFSELENVYLKAAMLVDAGASNSFYAIDEIVGKVGKTNYGLSPQAVEFSHTFSPLVSEKARAAGTYTKDLRVMMLLFMHWMKQE